MPHKDIWIKGNRLVSVTELTTIINKPFLEKWKQGLCVPNEMCGFVAAKKVADEASGLGTSVHEDVEMWFKGETPKTPWGIKIVDQYLKAKVKPFLHSPEEAIIDEESGLAGSPDHVIDGEWSDYNGMCVADLKIKNSLDTLTGMQGMGYRYLLRRKYSVDINRMLVMWCKKKTVSMIVEPVWIDLNQWVEPWKHLIGLWNVINPKRQVRVLD